MLLSTTPTIDGRRILEYKGVVTGETIVGANVLKDFMAGLRDFFGGRSGTYEKVLRDAKESAMREMEERAARYALGVILGRLQEGNVVYGFYSKANKINSALGVSRY